ncbi:hypothetical protein R5R35_005466 [Gryllus longicercus]|uniref:Cuticular protein n=1 Tax=Gryllus longicercus TaxID=2509291 RepID=A0AAN9VV34_9ORTH
MKLLVVLSGLLACAFGQVYYYSNPYTHFAPYSAIAPLTAPYAPVRYAPAPVRYSPAPVVAAAPIVTPVSSQFRAQDELGQFTFATAGDNQARVETGLLDGSVRGAYSYIDANGKLINVQYLADNNGFRVLGANNLPEAPAANPLKGPEPVKDTPEVVAARAEFQKQFAEAAAAAAAAPEHSQSRRKRQVLLTPFAAPLHVPAVGKATVRVQQFEPVAGAKVPASTQKVELKESDKEVAVPLAYAAAPAPAAYVAAAPHVYSVAAPHVYSPVPQVYSAAPQVYGVAPQVLAAPAPAPSLAKATVKVQQYEPVEAKVPASTQKVELKETEQEVVAPIAYSHLPYYNIFG